MKSITAAVAMFIGVASAAVEPYGYASNGDGWTSIAGYEQCGTKGGSPIDLKTELSQYQKYDIERDNIVSEFKNQRGAQIKWSGDSTEVQLSQGPNNFFSDIGATIFGAHTKEWNGVRFNFKSDSEHQIDGESMDMELQTYFEGDPNTDTDVFKYAAIGVLFSVNDYNVKLSKAEQLIIDTFFETLDWAKTDDPTVNLVTYGDLMNMVDLSNRWAYRGSVTIPPCQQDVYWNVLHTVYPIRKRHLDQFKSQLTTKGDLKGGEMLTGNRRKVQDITDQNPVVITETSFGSEKDSANDINYNININIYNQNVGGQCV